MQDLVTAALSVVDNSSQACAKFEPNSNLLFLYGLVSGLMRSRYVAWRATRYNTAMIVSFRHKGLRKYFETGSLAGIVPAHSKRLQMQLAALQTAHTIEDMDIPGFRLHALKVSEKGRWSVWVNGNWRMTFKFDNGNAHILDYEDYH